VPPLGAFAAAQEWFRRPILLRLSTHYSFALASAERSIPNKSRALSRGLRPSGCSSPDSVLRSLPVPPKEAGFVYFIPPPPIWGAWPASVAGSPSAVGLRENVGAALQAIHWRRTWSPPCPSTEKRVHEPLQRSVR